MENFKLMRGNVNFDIDDENGPSWMWDIDTTVNLNGLNYNIVETQHQGIMDFLSQFPDHHIAIVHSITCNGIRHPRENQGEGWGFNIREDLLTIEWYRIYV